MARKKAEAQIYWSVLGEALAKGKDGEEDVETVGDGQSIPVEQLARLGIGLVNGGNAG